MSELEIFPQNPTLDRPQGTPDLLHHGNGSPGRSPFTMPRSTFITRAEATELGVLGRTVWPKNGRKVKKGETGCYYVQSEKRIVNNRMISTKGYWAYSEDQTEPKKRQKRMPKGKMPISLPKSIPLKKLKRKFGKDIDRVKVFLHFLTMKKVFDRRLRDIDAFANLYSPILQKFMGNKYCKMINILNGWIIEVDKDYDFIYEHISKGYRFKEEILAEGYCHDFITDMKVIGQCDKARPTTRVDRHLKGFLTQLEIEEASLTKDELDYGQTHLIEKMSRGVWKYDADDYGRRHTNLTNLCRIGRNSLRYKGLPLVGFDIRNSQPLIFGITVMDILRCNLNCSYIKEKEGKKGILPYVVRRTSKEVEILLENSHFRPNSQLPQPVINFDSKYLPSDVRDYLDLCQQGLIYEQLMNEIGLTNRDCAKEIIFAVIYGPNRRHYENVKVWRSIEDYEWLVGHSNNDKDRFENSLPLRKLIYEAMEQMFPTVVQCMAEIKGKHYQNLAHQMQRAESEIIFGACRNIMNRHPDVPIWTIHDCLLTVPGHGYEEIVECSLLESFAKHGVKPSIKREIYGT